MGVSLMYVRSLQQQSDRAPCLIQYYHWFVILMKHFHDRYRMYFLIFVSLLYRAFARTKMFYMIMIL